MYYFKVYSEGWNELSLYARVVYTVIACKSDINDHTSHIIRERIAEFSGIRNLETISKATEELVEKEWLTKKTDIDENLHRHITYTLVNRGSNKTVTRDILDAGLSFQELAVFVSICSLRDDDGVVDYSCPFTALGIKKTTFYRYVNALKEKGLIKSDKGVFTILKYLPPKTYQLSQENKEFVDFVLTSWDTKSATYKKVKYYIDNNFKNVKYPDQLMDEIRIGVPKQSNEDKPFNTQYEF